MRLEKLPNLSEWDCLVINRLMEKVDEIAFCLGWQSTRCSSLLRLNFTLHSTASSLTTMTLVSPAYGYVSLALVKCSNEGGPGPRYNRKEVPGSSTLTMMVVHGYHLYLMPLFSEAGDKEPVWSPPPPPPPRPTWAKPPPTPFRYILHPLQRRR